MRIILLVLGILGLGFAGLIFPNAKSAIQEIEGLISAVFGIIGLGTAGIVSTLDANHAAHMAELRARAGAFVPMMPPPPMPYVPAPMPPMNYTGAPSR